MREIAGTNHTQFGVAMTAGDEYTIAGDGTAGFANIPGPATSAELDAPGYLVFDHEGNLLISDFSASAVLMLAAGNCSSSCAYGLSSTIAGELYVIAGGNGFGGSGYGGPASSAQLYAPTGLAVDAAGDVFIADQAGNAVLMLSAGTCTSSCPYGLSSTQPNDLYVVAGTGYDAGTWTGADGGEGGPATQANLNQPQGVGVASNGDLLIANASDYAIDLVPDTTCDASCPYGQSPALGGYLYRVAGSPGSSNPQEYQAWGSTGTAVQVGHPAGISLDAAGDALFSAANDNVVGLLAANSCAAACPYGIASLTGGYVYEIAGTGTAGTLGVGGPATQAGLDEPMGIATDASGDVVVADESSDRVLEVVASPSPLYPPTPGDLFAIGAVGGSGTTQDGEQSSVSTVGGSGVATDGRGNLYVGGANRVVEVAAYTETQWGRSFASEDAYTVAGSASGTSGTCANGTPATQACLDTPYGADMAVDAAGDLYIADYGNNRVVEVPASSGTQWGIAMTAGDLYTVAGSPSGASGTSANGAPAVSVALAGPEGIAFDQAGNLYIADSQNMRIVEEPATACTAGATTCPGGLSSESADDLYTVAGSAAGFGGSSGDGGPSTSALLDGPFSLAVDASGDLFVADGGNSRVQLFTAPTTSCSSDCPFGTSLQPNTAYTVAGSAAGTYGQSGYGAPAASALLGDVTSVALDSSGDLYLADDSHSVVDEVPSYVATVASAGAPSLPNEVVSGANPSELGPRQPKIASDARATGLSVDPATGEADVSVQDLSLPGRGLALGLTRSYSSKDASSLGPFGYGWVDSYDLYLSYDTSLGQNVVGVHQENGSVVYFMESPSGPTAPWITAPRVHASLVQNTDGTWRFVRDARVTYAFSATASSNGDYPLISESDLNGYTTTLSYNGAGQLASVTDPEGRSLTFTYNSAGLVSEVSDSAGQSVSYTYDASDDLATVTDVGGGVTTYGYDTTSHELTSVESPLTTTTFATTQLSYYTSGADEGYVAQVADPMGRVTSYAYDLTTTQSGPSGTVTVTLPRTYDGSAIEDLYSYGDGELLSVTDAYGTPEAAETSYAYFPGGDGTKSVTDPDGHTSAYTYDASGNLLSEANALGAVTDYTYNALDEVTSSQTPLQLSADVEVTYTYDADGNLLSRSTPNPTNPSAPHVTTYTYGTGCSTTGANGCYVGDVASVTDPNGHETAYTYDADGNGTSVTDALGNVTTYAYDALGRLTSVTRPPGNAPSPTTPGVIETVAGSASGTQGTGATGAPATSALLDYPSDAVFDTAGDEVIVDSKNNEVDLLAASNCSGNCPFGLSSMTAGDLYVIAGDGTAGFSGIPGPATSAEIDNPTYVAFDHRGNLLISLEGASAVVVLGATSCTSSCPYGLSSTTAGDLYVVAGGNGFGAYGYGGPATAAGIEAPEGLAVDAQGDVFVADAAAEVVLMVAAESCSSSCPYGLSQTTPGGLYVVAGQPSSTPWSGADGGEGGPATQAYLNFPDGLGIGAGGDLVIANYSDYAIDVVPAESCASGCPYGVPSAVGGYLYRVVGSPGSQNPPEYQGWGQLGTDVQVGHPAGIGIDEAGNVLFTAEKDNVVGFLAAGSCTSSCPYGASSTSPGYVYEVAGTGTAGTSGDGGQATSAELYAPTGLATDPSGNVLVADEENNRVQELQSGAGISETETTSYTYDAYGDVLSVTNPLGAETTATYNKVGDLLTETSPKGNETYNVYDADLELAQTTAAYGTSLASTTSYCYDPGGEKTAMVPPRGNTSGVAACQTSAPYDTTSPYQTTHSYDAAGNLISTVDPLGHATSATYDAAGNLVSSTDPDGNVTAYVYDAANRLVAETKGAGTAAATTSTFTYDADGNRTSYADGAGDETTYAYNLLDEVASSANPLSETTSYAYDGAGNEVSLTNPDGKVTTYTYNGDNQVSAIAYSDGSPPVAFTYAPDGAVSTMRDGTGMSAYVTDNAGELVSSTSGAGANVSYGYDQDGNVTSIAYPNGKSVTQSYDALERLTSVSDWLGNTTTFSYGADSNLSAIAYPNGITSTNTYDNADRLTGIADTAGSGTLASFSYSLDPASLLTSETDAGTPDAGTTTYGYNKLRELTSANSSTSSTYTYDRASNLTEGPSGATQTFNAANELCWSATSAGSCAAPPSGATSYTYSAEGNLTTVTPSSGGSTAYGWNQANELTSYTPASGSSASYTYDGTGLLASEVTGTATTAFTWNVEGSLPLLLSDGTNAYLYGPGATPIEQINLQSSTPSYLLSDRLGSVRAMTDATGAVTGSFTYDPWGNTEATSGSFDTPFGFAGGYKDQASGLYYFRARWYDAGTGQWMSLDPMVGATLAPYSYVQNDPLNGTDPTGLTSAYWVAQELAFIGQEAGVAHASASQVKQATAVVVQAAIVSTATAVAVAKTAVANATIVTNILKGDSNPAAQGAVSLAESHANAATQAAVSDAVAADTAAESESGNIALDTNVLIYGLEAGQLEQLDSALAGRAPIVSPTAQQEYLAKGNPDALGQFLEARGGSIGSPGTAGGAAALQEEARLLGKGLSDSDALVLDSAIIDEVPLLTADQQFQSVLDALGYPYEAW